MRFSGILSVSALLMAIVGCSDDPAAAIIENGTGTWRLGCPTGQGCKLFPRHVEDEVTGHNFSVSCKKSGPGYDITITDPGVEENLGVTPPRPGLPGGKLTILQANPSSSSCTSVRVEDRQQYGDPPSVYNALCSIGECTFTGGSAPGYDVVGTLHCTGLKDNQNQSQLYQITSGEDSDLTAGVSIKVDNCN